MPSLTLAPLLASMLLLGGANSMLPFLVGLVIAVLLLRVVLAQS